MMLFITVPILCLMGWVLVAFVKAVDRICMSNVSRVRKDAVYMVVKDGG